ncbi:MAG: TetR/AcrR family transcriptional regulator [Pseudomonadota bacterium]
MHAIHTPHTDRAKPMTPTDRRQRERSRRADAILVHARALITDVGAEGFQMERLARAAGCAKGTLYCHFPSREHVIVALANREFGGLLTALRTATEVHTSPTDRVIAAFEAASLRQETDPSSVLWHAARCLPHIRTVGEPGAQTASAYCRQHAHLTQRFCDEVDDALLLGELEAVRGDGQAIGRAVVALLSTAQTSAAGVDVGPNTAQTRLLFWHVIHGLATPAVKATLDARYTRVQQRTRTVLASRAQASCQ